ncbi:MAG: transporter [Magnetococcales bacterium]|nr:transporter [Magnetococcales bacterium]
MSAIKMHLPYFVSCCLVLFPSVGFSDNAPRDYLPAPPGKQVLFSSFEIQSGDSLYVNGAEISSNTDYRSELLIFKYARYGKLGTWNTAIIPIIGYGSASYRPPGANDKLRAQGPIDPILVLGTSHVLDKAGVWRIGLSNWLTIPLGEYDSSRLLNIGANRWATKPELNLTYRSDPRTFWEVAGSVSLFSDNDEYTPANRRLSREPLLAFESHVSHDFSSEWEGSLSFFFHGGGETSIDDVPQNNSRSDHALQTAVDWHFAPGWESGLRYQHALKVRSGISYDLIRFKISKVF